MWHRHIQQGTHCLKANEMEKQQVRFLSDKNVVQLLLYNLKLVKLRGTFDQCSPAVKNALFRAHRMPMYACQPWNKYADASMKRLRAAY